MRAAAVHRSLGLLACALALAHVIAVILTRGGIKPYSTLGWLPERLLDGGAVFLAGALMASGRVKLASAGLLAAVCATEYLRSFAPMPLCFLIAALADGLMLARRWALLPFVAGAALTAAYLVAQARSRGDEPAAPAPRPREVLIPDAGYEQFRVDTYLSSGVAPKRYFGFFDERGDTAEAEAIVRDSVTRGVATANAYAADAELDVRITEQEAAVTFLAEGGALLLTDAQDKLRSGVHPVRDEGLDNFRLGFTRFPSLVTKLDAEQGTRLVALSSHGVLLRPMTLREAVLGTVVMYLYEKQLTHELRQNAGLPALASLPLDRQFVTTSLVYNCGQLFSDDRVTAILSFSTGAYLVQLNADTAGKRPTLPVLPSAYAAARVAAGEPIPQQLTSWSAVYHVLQRWGAWTALVRFTTVFDANGGFRS